MESYNVYIPHHVHVHGRLFDLAIYKKICQIEALPNVNLPNIPLLLASCKTFVACSVGNVIRHVVISYRVIRLAYILATWQSSLYHIILVASQVVMKSLHRACKCLL